MLNRRDVSVGKYYVNDRDHTVREVITVMHHNKVVYNAYDLRSGNLLRAPAQICHKARMIRWADREARPEEVAKLKRDEATAVFEHGEQGFKIEDVIPETNKAHAQTELRNLTPSG
ncbi:MAG: hypothetical protein C3F07_14510 [Anaerolineales bacterium]|nr:hypothetical protein [Anaerolineae bacterium]PWB71318.1 MAG: hypothetical protein C3F07_14510 [Anaerolineales bacterium]